MSEQIQWRRKAGQFAFLHRASELLGVPVYYDRCEKVEPRNPEVLGLGCPVADLSLASDPQCTLQGMVRLALVQALAALREGDTLVVSKLDRLARSVPDARTIADELRERGVKLALGATVHDPTDPMGKMFFNIVATFAEFEADLIKMRTREGMAIAKAKGKLWMKQPKLSEKQQKELWRMHDTGEYSISNLAEVFSVSRPTVYRTLSRRIIA